MSVIGILRQRTLPPEIHVLVTESVNAECPLSVSPKTTDNYAQAIRGGSIFKLEVTDEKKLPQFDSVASARSRKRCWSNEDEAEADFIY
jgi:hypothetical protein